MSREYVTALKESLEKKLKVLEELQRMVKSQTELLSNEELDYDAFNDLMDERDILIEKLNKLDEGFELVYSRVSEELKTNKAAYADDITAMQKLITRITELTTSIEAAERRNKQSLDNAFLRDRRKASEGRRSVNVAMNYYKNMSGLNVNDSRYMDSKK